MLENIVNETLKKETLLCFSHLRWDFVYQRPQHLMSRFATHYNILYFEEPIFIDEDKPSLSALQVKQNIYRLLPSIPKNFSPEQVYTLQAALLDDFIKNNNFNISIIWYLSPLFIKWTQHLSAKAVVYDCMDELSAFKNAPIELKTCEQLLLQQADLVFTGGASLYKAKCNLHKAVHLFPSSVDVEHFIKARATILEPVDQSNLSHPRLGFYGVIDERFDIELINNLAMARPEWNFIFIGPIVKIDSDTLPQHVNIHYLGSKKYEELPNYLSSWDVALIPFAINESTKFISPTKTPEYLAGGKPVVSTPIIDIVEGYKDIKTVYIANPNNLSEFIEAIEKALNDSKNTQKLFSEADKALFDISWDKTYSSMYELILTIQNKKGIT